ncbi:MAG: hypothetical protein ACK5RJ_05835 [Burkholderiales bacterium]|nr:hypothetical protein [Rhodocyclaceae bacterium]MCA3023788.1 hypothetical protein [Rhodocyclaceae bacterium]MCA3030621.1 hypothetical protein [Rhodocyclaceae bacterium]MCA3047152.1 hypothetical protein [Rhodocyclaceae bacterium]MCA3049853.1 hypothetical protein [Rhodocyclaceae bacterium]
MKPILTGVVFVAALLGSSVAFAETQMLKISAVISSADKVIASPKVVVANGKTASIEIGEKGALGNWNTKAVFSPQIQDDGTVLMPVTVKLTTETVVDDKPQVSSRETTVQLKAALGKKFSISVPTNDANATFAMSMQVELLNDEASAAMRAKPAN